MKKFYIETWGCQMNEEDSEKISGMLKAMAHEKTDFRDNADIIIFNTCCVRENAEFKVHGNLGNLKKLKENKPELIIAVCGCMMQQAGVAESILKKYRHVDIVFGTHNAWKFPEYLERLKLQGGQIREIQADPEGIVEGIPIDRDSSLKAYVTIMYGCDNFCSYCIVPYVRGREKSRKSADIIREIEELVEKGYKEITLLGQNVNSYGKGLEEGIDFAGLLKRVNAIPGIERIRFMTSHAKDLTGDVIDAMRDSDKVTEQIHLPVQSGSTRILQIMNRKYTREKYLQIIREIREKIPGVAITTDIIVGFPGETESDFTDTLTLCEKVGFDSAFTFIYSNRNNTPADKMANQIPDEVKHERFTRLVEVINRRAYDKNAEYIGGVYDVLVEGTSKNNETVLTGRTRSGKIVNFEGDVHSVGKTIGIKINKANSFSLFGEPV